MQVAYSNSLSGIYVFNRSVFLFFSFTQSVFIHTICFWLFPQVQMCATKLRPNLLGEPRGTTSTPEGGRNHPDYNNKPFGTREDAVCAGSRPTSHESPPKVT